MLYIFDDIQIRNFIVVKHNIILKQDLILIRGFLQNKTLVNNIIFYF